MSVGDTSSKRAYLDRDEFLEFNAVAPSSVSNGVKPEAS
jgi:hypothetical protein